MNILGRFSKLALACTVAAFALQSTPTLAETLRLLTWGGYAPENVIELFTGETGIDVEVTLSNNEEMIAKLRANESGGFDLVNAAN